MLHGDHRDAGVPVVYINGAYTIERVRGADGMKKQINYAECSMFVLGLDMDCPLCGVKVESGQKHRCESPEPTTKKPVKPKRKAKK